MPSFASYPAGSDIAALLESAGLEPSNAADLDGAADLGRDTFEKVAGRKMLAAALDGDGNGQTRRYTPDWRNGGVMEVDDIAAFLGLTYHPYGGTPVILTREEDFELLPDNAPEKGQPYTRIQFYRTAWFGHPLSGGGTHTNARSLRIEAQFGYFTALPASVWGAMCMLGAYSLVDPTRQTQTKGVLSRKALDYSIEYGEMTVKALTDGWKARGERLAAQYQRLRL